MNITVIRHSIRNRGGDRLVLDYLAYLIRRGHEISYWTNEVKTHFRIDPKIQIKKIPLPGVLGTILFALLTRFKSDVILIDLVVMACFVSLRNNRKKIFYLAQGYDLSYHRSLILNTFINACYKLVLYYLKITTVAVSENLSKKLMNYQPLRLIAIPNGVDLNFFHRIEQPRFLKKKRKPYVILLFARRDYPKGLDIAIKTLKQLAKIRPYKDWEVWIIGSEKIEIAEVPIRNMGFLNDEDLRDILSASDAYLSSSRQEGFGLLQLQAMACGCVMLTTSAFSLIENNINGLVSPIEDWQSLAMNMNKVMDDSTLREKFKKNGRLLAEQYSLEKSCQKFEEVILTMMTPNQ